MGLPDCKDCEWYGSDMVTTACRDCLIEDDGRTHFTPKKKDMVNHPDHYKTESGLETIDVIEAFTNGLVGIEAVDTANVIKYICRWKKKNGLEDLKKAKWYLEHLINKKENE